MMSRIVHFIERIFDSIKYRVGGRFQSDVSLIIIPYMGYGSGKFVEMKGRVLEDAGIRPSREADRPWDNLLNMYRRFESDEVPHARVLARFRGIEQDIRADEEGYFEVTFRLDDPVSLDTGWHQIQLELLEPQNPGNGRAVAEGQVLIVSPQAAYGVISDIDDTVVHTGVTSRLKLASTILLKNAYSRLPLKGVAEFYNALQQGGGDAGRNPLFYVSSSPWNMYDLFREFFQINEIPDGPIFLRDWGFEAQSMLAENNRKYKLGAIFTILEKFQELKFILIGDSGEEDPEIYTQVIQDYPQRILGVYIRDVKHDVKRIDEIGLLAKQVEKYGIEMVLAEDAHIMAAHAARQGWISLSPASQPLE
jgi:phosphatidate phosphatase APP1